VREKAAALGACCRSFAGAEEDVAADREGSRVEGARRVSRFNVCMDPDAPKISAEDRLELRQTGPLSRSFCRRQQVPRRSVRDTLGLALQSFVGVTHRGYHAVRRQPVCIEYSSDRIIGGAL
jgi:hypothetical protein